MDSTGTLLSGRQFCNEHNSNEHSCAAHHHNEDSADGSIDSNEACCNEDNCEFDALLKSTRQEIVLLDGTYEIDEQPCHHCKEQHNKENERRQSTGTAETFPLCSDDEHSSCDSCTEECETEECKTEECDNEEENLFGAFESDDNGDLFVSSCDHSSVVHRRRNRCRWQEKDRVLFPTKEQEDDDANAILTETASNVNNRELCKSESSLPSVICPLPECSEPCQIMAAPVAWQQQHFTNRRQPS